MKDKYPLISIIIPVYNCEKTIKKCIDSILKISYPNYEVIIINDGSFDSTSIILSSYSDKIKVVNTKNVGPSEARNLGVQASKGEYIAFADGDCVVDKEWLNELLKGFVSQEVVGVGGDQRSPCDDSAFGRNINKFMKAIGFIADYVKSDSNSNDNKIREVKHNPTCNVIYKKKIFNEIDGFLKGFWPGEDVEFDFRARKKGYKLFYNADAVVYHYRADNLKKFSKMMFKYGAAQAKLLKKYGFFRLIQFVPLFILFFILLEILLMIKSFALGLLLPGILFFFVIGFYFWKVKNVLKLFDFLILLFLTVVVWSAGFSRAIIQYENTHN